MYVLSSPLSNASLSCERRAFCRRSRRVAPKASARCWPGCPRLFFAFMQGQYASAGDWKSTDYSLQEEDNGVSDRDWVVAMTLSHLCYLRNARTYDLPPASYGARGVSGRACQSPGGDTRGGILAALFLEEDVVSGVGVEGRVEVDQVNAGVRHLATQDVKIVAKVESVFPVHFQPAYHGSA